MLVRRRKQKGTRREETASRGWEKKKKRGVEVDPEDVEIRDRAEAARSSCCSRSRHREGDRCLPSRRKDVVAIKKRVGQV